jgi:hypothetical protein
MKNEIATALAVFQQFNTQPIAFHEFQFQTQIFQQVIINAGEAFLPLAAAAINQL